MIVKGRLHTAGGQWAPSPQGEKVDPARNSPLSAVSHTRVAKHDTGRFGGASDISDIQHDAECVSEAMRLLAHAQHSRSGITLFAII